MDRSRQLIQPDNNVKGCILTDLLFKPVAADRGAQTLIPTVGYSVDRREPAHSLPGDLLALLQSLSLEELADAHAHFHIGAIGYLCQVAVLAPCTGPNSRPLLALYVQRNPDATEAIRKIAEDFDLTDREHEALLNISTGLTCKEVAQRMKISPNTVKAFLRLIMIKMGVTRTVGILSKVLELTQTSNGAVHGSTRQE